VQNLHLKPGLILSAHAGWRGRYKFSKTLLAEFRMFCDDDAPVRPVCSALTESQRKTAQHWKLRSGFSTVPMQSAVANPDQEDR
jgi:hypothetical protein